MAKLPELYPHVTSVFRPAAIATGDFPASGPLGVTVHHAADRNLDRVKQEGVDRKEGYHLVIDRDGNCHQTTYFTHTVSHAGKAQWMTKSPNREHIAVSLLAWGRLVPGPQSTWLSWSKAIVKSSDVAFRPGNLTGGNFHWDAFTTAQEAALFEFLTWCIGLGMDPRNFCGHDECALPFGRKDDPGGSLSMTMSQLRMKLRANPLPAKSPASP